MGSALSVMQGLVWIWKEEHAHHVKQEKLGVMVHLNAHLAHWVLEEVSV